MPSKDAFYSQKVGDIYFNMIRVNQNNFKVWNDYINSDLEINNRTGIATTKVILKSFPKHQTKQHLWFGFVSNKPITNPNEIEGKGIEMFVTVSTSVHAPFTSHMGIQRVEGRYKHPKISTKLHAFCAQICKHVYPDKKYMVFSPTSHMRSILEDNFRAVGKKMLLLDDFLKSWSLSSAILKFPNMEEMSINASDHNQDLTWFFEIDALWGAKIFMIAQDLLGGQDKFIPRGLSAISLEDLGGLDTEVASENFTLHNNGIDIVVSDEIVQKAKELAEAIKSNDDPKVKKIAEEHPDAIHFSNVSGQSAIHYAAKSKCSDEVAAFILSKLGGNLDDMVDSKGFFPLDYAIMGQQITHGSLLIKRGATQSKLASRKDTKKARPYVELLAKMKEASETYEEPAIDETPEEDEAKTKQPILEKQTPENKVEQQIIDILRGLKAQNKISGKSDVEVEIQLDSSSAPEVIKYCLGKLNLGPDSLECDGGTCYVTLDPAAIELLGDL